MEKGLSFYDHLNLITESGGDFMDNLRNDAYNQIKYQIIHFDYVPGQKISEKTLSTKLSLGRTPVREALIRIEREGLIEVIPQSGTYITKIDLKIAEEGRFVRECIEPQIMTTVITQANPQLLQKLRTNLSDQAQSTVAMNPDAFFDLDQAFHHEFYKAAHKDLVWQWLLGNNTQLNRFRRLRLKKLDLDWQKLLQQHQQIFDAVVAHDLDELNFLVRQHLHLMLEEKQRVVEGYPDYFQNIGEVKSK